MNFSHPLPLQVLLMLMKHFFANTEEFFRTLLKIISSKPLLFLKTELILLNLSIKSALYVHNVYAQDPWVYPVYNNYKHPS